MSNELIYRKIERILTEKLEDNVDKLVAIADSNTAKPAERVAAIRELIKLQSDISDRNLKRKFDNLKMASSQLDYKIKLLNYEKMIKPDENPAQGNMAKQSRELDLTFSETG